MTCRSGQPRGLTVRRGVGHGIAWMALPYPLAAVASTLPAAS